MHHGLRGMDAPVAGRNLCSHPLDLENCIFMLSGGEFLPRIYRGVVGRLRMWTTSTHFFVWNDPLCTFYVRLWPSESLASTHFLWHPPASLFRTTSLAIIL